MRLILDTVIINIALLTILVRLGRMYLISDIGHMSSSWNILSLKIFSLVFLKQLNHFLNFFYFLTWKCLIIGLLQIMYVMFYRRGTIRRHDQTTRWTARMSMDAENGRPLPNILLVPVLRWLNTGNIFGFVLPQCFNECVLVIKCMQLNHVHPRPCFKRTRTL